MPLCIDACVLGCDRHLLVDGNECSWVDEPPVGSYHFSRNVKLMSDRCLDSLLRLNAEQVNIVPQRLVEMKNVAFGEESQVKWRHAIPKRMYSTYVKDVVAAIRCAFDRCDRTYYEESFVKGNVVLNALQPAKVDFDVLSGKLSSTRIHGAVLSSFVPATSCFTDPVKYDRFHTRTGRLKVESGPMIDVLPKPSRNVLTSMYGDEGEIGSVDYNACEMRVLLGTAGDVDAGHDFYSTIVKMTLGSAHGLERSIVKSLMIPAIYGMSDSSVSKKFNVDVAIVKRFSSGIRSILDVEGLVHRLRQQRFTLGHIKTFHGRRIEVPDAADHKLINSYAQATGVDVALMGFSTFVESARLLAPSFRPLFVVHDAFVFDCKKDEVLKLKEILNIQVPGFVQPFKLKLSAF